MYRDRRDNYNPYMQPYLSVDYAGNSVYQPVYDPNETARMADLLNKSQQRYDVGIGEFNEFQGQIGGMQTYDTNGLQNRTNEFTAKVQDVVKNQYNGDYGNAANEIAKMIAQEKSNPFYKFNAEQLKQAQAFEQAKIQRRNSGERFVGLNDPRKINLQEAMQNNDFTKLQADYLIAPDYDQVATELIKDVPYNASEFYRGLSKAEQATFGEAMQTGDLSGFLVKSGYASNTEKLKQLESGLSKSLYNKHKDAFNAEAEAAGFKSGEEYAKSVVKNKIPQLSFTKSTVDVDNMNSKDGGKSGNSNGVFRAITDTSVIDESTQDNINGITSAISEKRLSLNDPKYKQTGLSSYLGVAGTVAGYDAEKNKEYAKNLLVTSGVLPIGGMKEATLTAAGLTGLYAGAKNLESKLMVGLAKNITGQGIVEDAKNMVNDFVQLNGTIDGIPTTKDGNIDYDAYYPIVSRALLNGTAMQNKLFVLGGEDKDGVYNEKELNRTSGSAMPSNVYIKDEDGNEKSVNKDEVTKELGISEDVMYDDFKSSIYNPKTGKIQARYVSKKDDKTYSFEYVDEGISKALKPIHKIYKDVSSKGYSVVPFSDPKDGQLYLVSANSITVDENGNPLVNTYVYHTKDKNVLDNIKSPQDARNYIESKVVTNSDGSKSPLYDSLENYSGMIFSNINK